MKSKLFLILSGFCMSTITYGQSYTPVSLPHLFSNHMVLQKGEETSIWGGGQAGKTICLSGSWNPTDTVKVKVNGMGKWKASLKNLHYGGPYHLYISDGSSQIILKDIMIGEVWLCSGQSNMEWTPENGLTNQKEEIANANYPDIRFFNVPKQCATYPQEECKGHWDTCNPSTMKRHSAVAYFFGKTLNDSLRVPIGLIISAWGATEASVWCPTSKSFSNSKEYQDWILEKNKIWPSSNGIVYNQMIHPILPFTFKGAIWYQGESNRHQPSRYGEQIQTMIESWRERAQRVFPFYLVEIAPYHYNSPNNGPALIREEQEWIIQNTPQTGRVIISDCVDDLHTIHPINKRPVGERLARMALNKNYGQSIECESPTLHQAVQKGNRIIISFTFTSNGLICKGKNINGLEIAGSDKKFIKAQGIINKENQLIVFSPSIKKPYYVRYCFNDDSIGNLFNKAGLPVAPFRTDK